MLADFGDWLSPMLVKELRQGLKSWFFVIGFILLHLCLALLTWLMAEGGDDRDMRTAFWSIIGVIMNGVIPFTAFGSLHDERRGNTLDMLQLTRLSAWRIALGKWTALCGQILLIATTILPYFIVRHFAGGISLPLELIWFSFYVLLALLTAAMALGVSWIPIFLIRGLLTLAIVGGAVALTIAIADDILAPLRYGIDRIPATEFRWMVVGILVTAAWGVWFFLDFGASQIAPISENRATPRRIVNGLVVLLGLTLSFIIEPTQPQAGMAITGMTGLFLFFVSFFAFAEPNRAIPPVVQPFERKGRLARLSGWVLYPGWAPALFWFCLLLIPGTAIFGWHFQRYLNRIAGYGHSFYTSPERQYQYVIVGWLAFVGGLFAATGIMLLLRKKRPVHLGWLTLVTLLMLMVQIMLFATSFTRPLRHAHWAGLFSPSMALPCAVAIESQVRRDSDYFRSSGSPEDWQRRFQSSREQTTRAVWPVIALAAASTAFWFLFLLVRALREMKLYRAVEEELHAERLAESAATAAGSPPQA